MSEGDLRPKSLLFPILLTASLAAPASAAWAQVREAHLLSRATYGPRPQDVSRLSSMGTQRWLEEQLRPSRIDDSAVAEKLKQYESLEMSVSELATMYAPGGKGMKRPQQLLGELVAAKLVRAVESERQLEEVMTDFWFNHFNVFFNDGPVRYMVADYEQNAIRPHVFGRFEDMLLATAQHPAMLVYLDNHLSTIPPPVQPAGPPRRPQRGGLNENYARELLELHTLGVDGGYTQ